MSMKTFKAGVKKFQGWIEGEVAYFPSVYLKEQFEKWCAEQEATK
jgi:hypothetical protein